jgi:hypothetical protein
LIETNPTAPPRKADNWPAWAEPLRDPRFPWSAHAKRQDATHRRYYDLAHGEGAWDAAWARRDAEPVPTTERPHSARLGDFLAIERGEYPYLIDRMVPAHGLTVLIGSSKIGKSFLALQMAIAVSTATDFMGITATGTPVPTLFIEEEGGEHGLEWRLRKMATYAIAQDAPLYVWARPRLVLNTTEGIAALREEIEHTGAKLVIVGTLNATTKGIDENDASLGEFAHTIQDLAQELRVAIILPHHLNKAASRTGKSTSIEDMLIGSRGSGSLIGAAESIIGIARKAKDDIGKLIIQPRESGNQELYFEIDPGTRAIYPTAETMDAIDQYDETFVLSALCQADGPRTVAEIHAELGWTSKSRDTVQRRFARLLQRHLIEKAGTAQGSNALMYQPTTAGQVEYEDAAA